MKSSTSVTVSARECAASDSIAEEWLISPPISLATAIARFAAPATMTVPVDSPSDPPPDSSCGRGLPCWASPIRACRVVGAGCVMHPVVPRRGTAQPCRDVTRVGLVNVWSILLLSDRAGSELPAGTPGHRRPTGALLLSADAHEVDDEDQRRAGL